MEQSSILRGILVQQLDKRNPFMVSEIPLPCTQEPTSPEPIVTFINITVKIYLPRPLTQSGNPPPPHSRHP